VIAWEVMCRTGIRPSRQERSVGSWLQRVPNRRARRILEVLVSVSTTADLDRFSMQAFLAMIRHEGGLATMLATAGGAQDSLLVEGAGTLAERLAAGLDGKVVYDSPVTALHRDDDGVTVHSATGVYRAARAIVTVPPPMAAGIEHRPALPTERIGLQDNTYMGSVYKAIAIYDCVLARARRCGTHFPGRARMAVLDTSPPDGPGHLCVLIAGPEARNIDKLSDTDRRSTILRTLAAHLGTGALEPRGWHEKSWHLDPTSAAATCPADHRTHGRPPPVSAEPTGHIHWAGTETAGEHAGYIEGAIESRCACWRGIRSPGR
jgi:monoamine oxidase